jgi:hypothetical protein
MSALFIAGSTNEMYIAIPTIKSIPIPVVANFITILDMMRTIAAAR